MKRIWKIVKRGGHRKDMFQGYTITGGKRKFRRRELPLTAVKGQTANRVWGEEKEN